MSPGRIRILSLGSAEESFSRSSVSINSTFQINNRYTLCGRISGDSRRKNFFFFFNSVPVVRRVSATPRFAGSVYFCLAVENGQRKPCDASMQRGIVFCFFFTFFSFPLAKSMPSELPNGIYIRDFTEQSLIIGVYTRRVVRSKINSDQL